MLDELFSAVIASLPRQVQWAIMGVCLVLLVALLDYLWSTGNLRW